MKLIVYACLFLFIISSSIAIAPEDITLNNFVIDQADMLTQAQEQELTSILQGIRDKGLAEYAIVIIDSNEGIPLAEYAITIGHEKIGSKDDRGIITLIAVNEREYYTAIGYGLEGVLNDARIGRLQREYLVPKLIVNDYSAGLIQLTKAVSTTLETGVEPTTFSESSTGSDWMWLIMFIVIFIIVFSLSKQGGTGGIIFFGGVGPRNRGGGGFGGFGGGGFGGGGAGGKF